MTHKVIPIVNERDYYCSNKFTFLKIDFEKQATYNCHAAYPHPIDFDWLEKNPGQLFNIPINVAERELMLDNQRNQSCEANCYPAEDRGQTSARILQSTGRHYSDVVTYPEEVDFTMFSECNLTCSYCCKEFSSAWRQDLLSNGSYNLPDYSDKNRMNLLPIDRVISKLSQAERADARKIKILLDDFYRTQKHIKKLMISGGEPFLNNHLLEVLENVKNIPRVNIYTGLGVNITRLKKMLAQILQYKNVVLCISAESTEENYEFNRYGMKWNDFLEKITLIEEINIAHEFRCTISNLTAIGFPKFYKKYQDKTIHIDFVHNPDFMEASNLDPETKTKIITELEEFNSEIQIQQIIKTISSNYKNDIYKSNMLSWLNQFATRRNLDLTIYPKTFLDWLTQ